MEEEDITIEKFIDAVLDVAESMAALSDIESTVKGKNIDYELFTSIRPQLKKFALDKLKD